jgi:hypothetical protein
MYTDRQISSLVVCLHRPDSADRDLALLRQLRPDLDVSSFAISPRRYQPTILRHLLSVTTRDEIERNRTAAGGVGVSGGVGVPPARKSAPQKKETAKKKSSPKKKSIPASDGTTSTTVTPSSPPSSTTTE